MVKSVFIHGKSPNKTLGNKQGISNTLKVYIYFENNGQNGTGTIRYKRTSVIHVLFDFAITNTLKRSLLFCCTCNSNVS